MSCGGAQQYVDPGSPDSGFPAPMVCSPSVDNLLSQTCRVRTENTCLCQHTMMMQGPLALCCVKADRHTISCILLAQASCAPLTAEEKVCLSLSNSFFESLLQQSVQSLSACTWSLTYLLSRSSSRQTPPLSSEILCTCTISLGEGQKDVVDPAPHQRRALAEAHEDGSI